MKLTTQPTKITNQALDMNKSAKLKETNSIKH